MTKEQAMAWAETVEAGEKLWEMIDRWQQLGYEPKVCITSRGDLCVSVSTPLSDGEEACGTEKPAEGRQTPLLPPE